MQQRQQRNVRLFLLWIFFSSSLELLPSLEVLCFWTLSIRLYKLDLPTAQTMGIGLQLFENNQQLQFNTQLVKKSIWWLHCSSFAWVIRLFGRRLLLIILTDSILSSCQVESSYKYHWTAARTSKPWQNLNQSLIPSPSPSCLQITTSLQATLLAASQLESSVRLKPVQWETLLRLQR